MEMQCYCDEGEHNITKHGKYIQCKNTIPYLHHHDWGKEEDYTCPECLENCLNQKD